MYKVTWSIHEKNQYMNPGHEEKKRMLIMKRVYT